jgi:hypothetical protein
MRWWQYLIAGLVTAALVMMAIDASSPNGWIDGYRQRQLMRAVERAATDDADRQEARQLREEQPTPAR